MDWKKKPVQGPGGQPPQTDMQMPVLKKPEKERKGGAMPLPGGAASAPAVKFGLVLLKKAAVMVLVAGVTGGGMVAYKKYQDAQARKGQPTGDIEMGGGTGLEAPAARINVKRRHHKGSRSLGGLQQAAQGEVKWEDRNAVGKAGAGSGDGADPDMEQAEDLAVLPDHMSANEGIGSVGGEDGEGRLEHNLSGAKLSSQLGGGFGKYNVFQRGDKFNLKNTRKLGGRFQKGVLTSKKANALARVRRRMNANRISTRRVGAARAMGQLKFSNKRSMEAKNAGDSQTGSQYAADAFEQGQTEGGEGGGEIGSDMDGEVQPQGGDAPDVTSGGGGGYETPQFEEYNATPYQGLMDNAEGMIDSAKQMLWIGFGLIALGAIIMWASGWTGIGAAIGAIIAAAGLAMCLCAMMMMSQARDQAEQIRNQFGQDEQAHIVDRHATNSGNRAYKGPQRREIDVENTARDDIREEQESTYEYQ